VAENREVEPELRPWEPFDRDAVVEAARDPYVAEIERIGEPDEWIARKRANGGLAIVVDGAVAGGVDVAGRHPRVGELGYFVLERFRRRGIAGRAASLVVRRALTDEDYVRVQATVEPWSVASQRVLEHAGLRREGLLRSYIVYGGRVGDAYLYAAVRGDV
jgi:[ribosomal protein S5]-alanine N-acetyltransferase